MGFLESSMASRCSEANSACEIVRTRPALGQVSKKPSLLGFPAGVYMDTPARVYKDRLRVGYDSGVALLGRLGLYASFLGLCESSSRCSRLPLSWA